MFISVAPATPVRSVEPRKLDFVFLLHANQALVPYGDVANDLNYRYVLKVFRNHPSLNLTIHISGTLISTLQYLSRDTLDLISEGVNDGQFELVGSTYMQNVPYSQYPISSGDTSGGDFDNLLGMELHRKILNETFGVSPRVFWNPERVWDPDIIAPIVKKGGYDITFIEDHIIAGGTSTDEHLVRSTGEISDPLYILSDDRDLVFNDTAGKPGLVDVIQEGPKGEDYSTFMNRTFGDLIGYLKDVYNTDPNDEKAVVYAQDMEAWGLWQEERGTDSVTNVAKRLDDLLTRFEQESDWLQLSHPTDVVESLKSRSYSFEHLTIPFGEAMWMTQGAKQAGKSSWKDWQDHDIALANYRRDFATARQWMYEGRDLAGENKLANKIYETMKYVYTSNQFEFGCWGCNFWWWSRTKEVGIGLEGIKWATSSPSDVKVYSKDLDGDSFSEIVMSTPHDFYVFSPSGGRLIAWFSLESEDILLYNEAPASYMQSAPSNYLQYPGLITGFWGRSTKDFYIRQGSFIDFPRYNFTTSFSKSTYSKSLGDSSLTMTYTASDSSVKKTFTATASSLLVDYEVTNMRDDPMPFYSSFSFNDGSEYLLGKNGDIAYDGLVAEFRLRDSKVGLINTQSNEALYVNHDSLFSSGAQLYLGDVSSSEHFQLILDATDLSTDFVVDQEKPTLTLLSPSNGTELSGILKFEVTATDNTGILSIQLLLNSTLLFERSNSGTLSYYNSEMLTGYYTFTIRAIDVYGNSVSKNVTIHYSGKDPVSSVTSSSNSSTQAPLSISILPVLLALPLRRRKSDS